MRTTEVGGPNPFATKRQWMVCETTLNSSSLSLTYVNNKFQNFVFLDIKSFLKTDSHITMTLK